MAEETDEDDDDLQNKKMAERTYRPNKADMATWSPFARAIGTFFCEAGVHGGARGKLFGLNPLKVENLTLANLSTLTAIQIAEDGISDTEPLVALGCTAVWVMEVRCYPIPPALAQTGPIIRRLAPCASSSCFSRPPCACNIACADACSPR